MQHARGAQQHVVRALNPLDNPGDLRRLTPIGADFFERGQPIDRYYIGKFLAANAAAIRGRVLEIQDNRYTREFGGDRVTQSDVLHADPGNPAATIVADLTQGDDIPSNVFDCIILTQTLRWGDFWRFTGMSGEKLFADVFQAAQVQVVTCGNVLAAIAFLHNLAVQEFSAEELDYIDPTYEVIVPVRAMKADA